MPSTATPVSVRTIGANGQISLGKQFAGQQVLVEEQAPGVWLVRTVAVVPNSERWVQQTQVAVDLQNAVAWAQVNPPSDANVDELLEQLHGGR